jgi:hypothetical protein
LGQFSKNHIELFTQKIVTKLSNIWVWEPGYGKNLLDLGDKKVPDPGSRSATLVGKVRWVRKVGCDVVPTVAVANSLPDLTAV